MSKKRRSLLTVNNKLVTKEEGVPKIPFTFRKVFGTYDEPRYHGDGQWTFCDEGDIIYLKDLYAAIDDFAKYIEGQGEYSE